MHIEAIPIYKNNYVWMIVEEHGAWAIDPGDHKPVISWLNNRQLVLNGILITHHHWDHITGVLPLQQHYNVPNLPVYGPSHAGQQIVNHPLSEGGQLVIGQTELTILETPGHTLDHICYFIPEHQILICGDTLFRFGCGRLLGGTAKQHFHSLQRIKNLPAETRVYCTHEYTLDNLQFALTVDPQNSQLKSAQTKCQKLRNTGQPTIPFTLDEQQQSNPFLRTNTPEIREAVQQWNKTHLEIATEETIFSLLRQWKDQF